MSTELLQNRNLRVFANYYHEALDAIRLYDAVSELAKPKTDTVALIVCFEKSSYLAKTVGLISTGFCQFISGQNIIDGHMLCDDTKSKWSQDISELIRYIIDKTCGGSVAIPTDREGLGMLLSEVGKILKV